MGSGLRGVPWKEFSRSGFFVGKADSVNRSKHVPRKCLLDDNDDDGDEDDAELRYLAKMRMKSFKGDDEDEGGSRKQRKLSSVLKMERRKTPRTGRESELTDYT
nr:INO80 complex subunit B-like conserved region [Tanacetum cinerariifolium]